MAQHRFKLRACYRYSGEDNQVEGLEAEIQTDDGWQALDLNLSTPGFLIFVYSLLVCQHTYFHANSTETGLQLDRAEVDLLLVAGDDWKIRQIEVGIRSRLRSGEPAAETIAYIVNRMRQCPVSINLDEPENYRIDLDFSQTG